MIEEDNPDLKPEEILAHALHAKNSLQIVHGFSSYQLVFGQLDNIPGTPTMLDDNIHRRVMIKHLNALYSDRQAYIKSESDSKIKVALKCHYGFSKNDLSRRSGQWRAR